jgi:hypothetical protein
MDNPFYSGRIEEDSAVSFGRESNYSKIILAVLKCWEDQCGHDTFRFMKYSDIKINARENWLSDETLTQITLGRGHRAKKNVQRRNTKINKTTQKKNEHRN